MMKVSQGSNVRFLGAAAALKCLRKPVAPVEGRDLSSRQTQYVVKDLEIEKPINSNRWSEAADGVARESAKSLSVSRMREICMSGCVSSEGWHVQQALTETDEPQLAGGGNCVHRKARECSGRHRVDLSRDGIVLERSAIEGMRVQPGGVLFRIADHCVMWALIDVAERELGMISYGKSRHGNFVAVYGPIRAKPNTF
jgi:hypothetical protein